MSNLSERVLGAAIEIHTDQLITYLKLSGCSLDYLLNFNVTKMKDSIKRVIYNPKKMS